MVLVVVMWLLWLVVRVMDGSRMRLLLLLLSIVQQWAINYLITGPIDILDANIRSVL